MGLGVGAKAGMYNALKRFLHNTHSLSRKERRALIRNQATDLLMKGKIETTVAKAKYLKSYVEKIF